MFVNENYGETIPSKHQRYPAHEVQDEGGALGKPHKAHGDQLD